MTDIQLDSESFFGKMQKMHQTWNQVKLEEASVAEISRLLIPNLWHLAHTLSFSIPTSTQSSSSWEKSAKSQKDHSLPTSCKYTWAGPRGRSVLMLFTLPARKTLIWLKFSLWLLNWEFSDTILLLTKTKTIFAVSQKKGKLSRVI